MTTRVALYGNGGSPYNHAAILARAGYEIEFVFAADIQAGALAGFDAFVMPGGGYRAMQGQLAPLSFSGCRAIREYVEAGGMYIGSCAGSYDAATVPEHFRQSCPEQAELCLLDAQVWNDGDSMLGGLQSPGVGEIVAATTRPDHPVMAGLPAQFQITHYNGPLFRGGDELARVVGRTERFTPAEAFMGASDGPYLIDEAVEAGVANIVAGSRGLGRVVLFGSHPEFGSSLTMDDVGVSATLLLNAVLWQEAESPGGRTPTSVLAADAIADDVLRADLNALPGLVERLRRQCESLAARADTPPWLGEGASMSMFGRPAAEIWSSALDRIPVLAAEAMSGAHRLTPQLISFRPPPDWAVDGGFHGLVPLLEQSVALLDRAVDNWDASFPGHDAYAFMTESPYHLVAGSYLAAVGRVAAAALLARTVQSAPAA